MGDMASVIADAIVSADRIPPPMTNARPVRDILPRRTRETIQRTHATKANPMNPGVGLITGSVDAAIGRPIDQ